MEITTIELRKLTAAEGMVLTNGEAYGKEIYLGKGDEPENWYEITEEKYKEIQNSMDEEFIETTE